MTRAESGDGAEAGRDLRRLYADRFSGAHQTRDAVWRVLCENYFQRWVPRDAVLLEVAAGHCEFVNNIVCDRRIAVDLNPDITGHAARGVETHVTTSTDLSMLADGTVDVAFVSNFFEHISRESIVLTLRELRRVIRPGGRLLVLQPNIRYCARDYWMFFDHVTPLDDRSLSEALGLGGFTVQYMVRRFLPYTTKGRLPARPWMVRAYLRFPPAWRLLGAQSFVVAG